MLDVATEYGIINKSGSWYTYGEERVQGRDGLKKILTEKPELFTQMETQVRKILSDNRNLNSQPIGVTDNETDE